MATSEIRPKIGFEGECTIGGGAGRFTELQYTPKTYTMIDVTTTADGGMKTYTKGCYDEVISGTLLVDDSASLSAIAAACEARAAVQCTFTLGTFSASGLMHPNFSGPMTCAPDDRVTVPFECRPAPMATST